MTRGRRRYRTSFLLQVLIVFGSATGFLLLGALVDGLPLVVALVVFVVWLVALELEVLPLLIEWWVLRWAERHAPAHTSLWFVDLDARTRSDQPRREVEGNPSLW